MHFEKKSPKQSSSDEDENLIRNFRKVFEDISMEKSSSDEDGGMNDINPGPSKYRLRIKSRRNDKENTCERWEKETLSSSALEGLSQSIQSWRASINEDISDNSFLTSSEITSPVLPKACEKLKSDNKGKCIIGRKNTTKNCRKKHRNKKN